MSATRGLSTRAQSLRLRTCSNSRSIREYIHISANQNRTFCLSLILAYNRLLEGFHFDLQCLLPAAQFERIMEGYVIKVIVIAFFSSLSLYTHFLSSSSFIKLLLLYYFGVWTTTTRPWSSLKTIQLVDLQSLSDTISLLELQNVTTMRQPLNSMQALWPRR